MVNNPMPFFCFRENSIPTANWFLTAIVRMPYSSRIIEFMLFDMTEKLKCQASLLGIRASVLQETLSEKNVSFSLKRSRKTINFLQQHGRQLFCLLLVCLCHFGGEANTALFQKRGREKSLSFFNPRQSRTAF